MLILAGVSIATLTGQNGILTKVNTAKIRQSHAQVEEGIKLAYAEYQAEILTKSTTGHVNTKVASMETVKIAGYDPNRIVTFMDFLYKEKKYIDEDGVIDIEALTGGKTSLGNGEGLTDVYKIEDDETNHQYVLTYYETADKIEELCTIKQSETPETKTMKIYTDESLSEVYLEFSYVEGMTWFDLISGGLTNGKLFIYQDRYISDVSGDFWVVKPDPSSSYGFVDVEKSDAIDFSDYYLRMPR